jgi:hypothetical protein
MSQFFIATTSGNLPPNVPTQFTADDATVAVPAANNINLFSDDTTANNVNGIRSTASGSTLTYQLTNRVTGTATTTDGTTPQTIYSFALGATPGTYLFRTYVSAFDTTNNLSAGYASYRVVRTTGAAATAVGTTTAFTTEEGALSGANVVNDVSGNNATLTATGIDGATIHWIALTEYLFIS